jgi:hypothetical protein
VGLLEAAQVLNEDHGEVKRLLFAPGSANFEPLWKNICAKRSRRFFPSFARR